MRTRYINHSSSAIRAVFDPEYPAGSDFRLPRDFFVDPAPWNLPKWQDKLSEYIQFANHGSIRASELLLSLIKHIVGLPAEERADCVEKILEAMSVAPRINLDQLLRIAHQITSLPQIDQGRPLHRLKIVAAETLSTKAFGKASFDLMVKSLGLNKPGPWLQKLQTSRHTSKYFSHAKTAGETRRASAAISAPSSPIGLDVDSAFAEIDRLFSNEDNALDESKQATPEISPSLVSTDFSTIDETIDYSVDMEAIDALMVDIDAGLASQWKEDFDRYVTGCGDHRSRAETLTRLLANFESLPPSDRSHYIEKLFDQMNDGTPVEYKHAHQLWLHLSALRQKNPAIQIAPDFGRVVMHWALTAHWAPDDFSAANAMLHG